MNIDFLLYRPKNYVWTCSRYLAARVLGRLLSGRSKMAHAQSNACLIEGENCQFKGKWFTQKDKHIPSGRLLCYTTGKADSLSCTLTIFNLIETDKKKHLAWKIER